MPTYGERTLESLRSMFTRPSNSPPEPSTADAAAAMGATYRIREAEAGVPKRVEGDREDVGGKGRLRGAVERTVLAIGKPEGKKWRWARLRLTRRVGARPRRVASRVRPAFL